MSLRRRRRLLDEDAPEPLPRRHVSVAVPTTRANLTCTDLSGANMRATGFSDAIVG